MIRIELIGDEEEDKPTNQQLLRDVSAQTRTKLQKWITDTAELFEMADLPHRECMSVIMSEMTYHAIRMLDQFTEITPEQFGEIMKATLADLKKAKARKRNA